jgi:hypothetical protein
MQVEVPPAHGSRTGWQVSCGIAVPLLANGTVLFDQPDLARIPYLSRVWGEITGPVFALILIGVIFALTRDRDKSLSIS